jgi:hypothetical protein
MKLRQDGACQTGLFGQLTQDRFYDTATKTSPQSSGKFVQQCSVSCGAKAFTRCGIGVPGPVMYMKLILFFSLSGARQPPDNRDAIYATTTVNMCNTRQEDSLMRVNSAEIVRSHRKGPSEEIEPSKGIEAYDK